MDISTPRPVTNLPVSSEGLRRKYPLHLGHAAKGGRCILRLVGKDKAFCNVLTAPTGVPTKEPKCNQGSIITGARRPEKTTEFGE
ncbi:hypothetical protein Tco_0383526 [Tanacetum coccineum]